MKYHIVQLGCQMNISDGERVQKALDDMGFEVTENEEEANVLGIIACSVRQKGIEYLLEAMKTVIGERRKTGLLMVGKGALRKDIEKRARRLGISDNVRFTGFVPEKELPYVFSSADLMVLPSISEPFGIALIEAMAAGLPVIGSRVGGIPEIIDEGVNGFIVPPKNPDRLASAILRLISDDKLRKSMGIRGRELAVKKFDWDIIAEKTERFYDKWNGEERK